ncbi:hypothetical protein F5J12DRAFT_935082 [Pisolithus orientalis]|uniref:uncharacterized protein n=1 Tax=Pisolithus orientalis TaxID=936130 RepID=UPI002224770D|nr:uncharacterized protein F5J12DRAFT_935082 [Pisolithus orientalis]KAI6009648.1 hypothetical protein F5J12DRAFT_935082 [Pisolithus orientalis]
MYHFLLNPYPSTPSAPLLTGVPSPGNHLVHYLPELMPAPANGTTITIVLDNLAYGFHAILPPHSLFVLLMRLLEAFDHLRVALVNAEARIIGGSVLIIHEGNWVRAETAVWRPEGISVLNDKPTASDEFGLGRKEAVALYEEDEDEDKITVELDEHGPLDGVVATSPVVECFEDNDDEDEAEEDDSPLFALSLIDFAHTRLAPG